MQTPLPSPWATTQTDLLSPEAVRALAARGVLRDPARAAAAGGRSPDAAGTVGADDLRALLREKGLPVFESVLDLERRCGGVLWGKDTFGAGAALRSGFDLRTLAGLVGSDLRDELGEDVVPVSFRADLPRALFWMNEAGRLYLSHEADTFPAAESLGCFWEREALKADERLGCELRLHWSALPTGTESDFLRFEARPDDDDDDGDDSDDEDDGDDDKPTFRRYEDDPQRAIDERLAEALGLPLFAPATDVWRRVWFDGDRLLYPHHPWQPAERLVRAVDMGTLARMAAAIAGVRPTALAIYKGPVGAPPAPGEPVIARLPAGEDASAATAELLFVGIGDTCRAHLVRRGEPLTVHDAWRAREAAFRSRGE